MFGGEELETRTPLLESVRGAITQEKSKQNQNRKQNKKPHKHKKTPKKTLTPLNCNLF